MCYTCTISEVVSCLSLRSPSRPHVFPCFMCVLPILFHSVPPFTMTIAACWDPLPCIVPTTAGYWQGPFHCCNPPWTIKDLARQARPPSKEPTPHLLCLLYYQGRRQESCWVYALWFLSGLKGEGLGFMYLIACNSLNGQENC